ncbi:glycoside hydrolase family 38 C-terminal domain-containing protein [Olsenella uli]|uniref:glycoside hydrolase family 38 N-terminal domain-containing protein n=1 Tax=Olsenella uli TaxID=133926 RepID=UPI0012AC20BC|nr:glycoside hydrolase family 38 C-terminal domain-containing protein [Olsenella uli]
MTRAFIVQHTHWDREWYFTTEDAQVLSDQVFTEALDELERNPNVTFCLDGQLSVVDEYVALNPDRLPVIKRLMAEGRLQVGPWYTQSDCLLPGAESLLRNLEVGILETRRGYGEPMMVGYTPDTFGFNAQMPTLLRQVGIDSFIAWRGINYETQVPSPYFSWKGLSGRSVNVAYFPHGYLSGMMQVGALDRIPDFVERRLDPEIEFLASPHGDEDILMPAGIDQKSMLLDFDKIVDRYNETSKYECRVSSYPEFMELLRHKEGLPEYQGELREPVYARVHRSIGSARTQMKQEDTRLERQLVDCVEPLLVIARACGVRVSNGVLLRAWKKLFENQAHDSMGGCVSDNVAEDIMHRLKEIAEISDGIENLVGKRIADALGLGPNEILVFNTEPVSFEGEKVVHVVSRSKDVSFFGSPYAVIENERYYPAREGAVRHGAVGDEVVTEPAYYELDVRIRVSLPALGYTVVEMREGEAAAEEYEVRAGSSISRDGYTVSFADGAVRLEAPGGCVFERAVELVDCGNDGDTYDFSPLPGERERTLPFDTCEVRTASGVQELVVSGSAELPYDLAGRLADEPDKTGEVAYVVRLRLSEGSRVEGSVEIDNKVLSHRMRLRVETGAGDGASVAQIQGGFLRRERVEAPADWTSRYEEKPAPIETFDGSVSVEGDGYVLTFYADGVKEYECDGSGLFVTLLATTGQLGKANLEWRPGRASGDTTTEGHVMMPTPLAQELGRHEVSFAISVDGGSADELRVAEVTRARRSPSVSYQRQGLNLFINRLDNKIWPAQYPPRLSREASVASLPDGLLVSALMPSLTRDDAFVVRLANPTARSVPLPAELPAGATQVNAVEDAVEPVDAIGAYDYVTLLISLS